VSRGWRDTEPLRGQAAPSPWDPALAARMAETGQAVTEERLICLLLADLNGVGERLACPRIPP